MFSTSVLDSEEAKSVAVVHKTNQGYSGKDLYRLKAEHPELFAAAPSSGSNAENVPRGYRVVSNVAGYYYNAERNVYWEKASGRFLCLDATTNEYYELVNGQNLTSTLSVRGDAAACTSRNGGAGGRHVAIGDLHKAAAAMKLDMSHHDNPAAMFAIYDSGAGGSAVAEAAAKGFHVRLLPRLAAYRGQWSDDRLQAAVSESMEALRSEINSEGGIGMAVALLFGKRLILAGSCGGLCMLFGAAGTDEFDGGEETDVDLISDNAVPSVRCIEVEDVHLGVLLTVDAMYKAGISPTRLRSLVRMHVVSDRPRAACIGAIAEARRGGCEAPLVASAVRLTWTDQDSGGPTKKRPKTTNLSKVRCRHILLRHAASQNAGDRRPKATRSAHEAEAEMLALLQELQFGGAPAFTTKCKAVSECDTALKGGDLSGDLGWLDKDLSKNKKVPPSVVRAALSLQIGQFSDVISSERGAHLLLRAA